MVWDSTDISFSVSYSFRSPLVTMSCSPQICSPSGAGCVSGSGRESETIGRWAGREQQQNMAAAACRTTVNEALGFLHQEYGPQVDAHEAPPETALLLTSKTRWRLDSTGPTHDDAHVALRHCNHHRYILRIRPIYPPPLHLTAAPCSPSVRPSPPPSQLTLTSKPQPHHLGPSKAEVERSTRHRGAASQPDFPLLSPSPTL